MAWIESHQAIKDHPKTLVMCDVLNISRAQVIGHLHLLWWWCLDYALDGSMANFSSSQISKAAEWTGDPVAFVSALEKSRYMVDGKINDWDEYTLHYNLSMEKKDRQREQIRERVKRWRNANVTHGNGAVTQCNAPTYQPNQPNQPNQPIPPKAFSILWEKYPRQEGRKAAEKHFNATVKKMQDWLDIQNALENYIQKIHKEKTDDQFIMHGKTWFNNWRDYVNYRGVVVPQAPKPKVTPKPIEKRPEWTEEELRTAHMQRSIKFPCRNAECKWHKTEVVK